MNQTKSDETAKTWSRSALHSKWESVYRGDANVPFYLTALRAVFSECNLNGDLHILDAGCGSGTKSLLLANQGFRVTGIDVSPEMLQKAQEKALTVELNKRTEFQSGNLISLSFADEVFDCVLCWGVLMHIPDVETALSELIRVLKPGGFLVISEGNLNALQARITRLIKSLRPRANEQIERKPAGMESWIETEDGLFLTRQADVSWLKQRLESEACRITLHRAGEFTEWYTKVRSPLIRKLIHAFNSFWFHRIRIPFPAFGNLITAQKMKK